MIGVLLAGLLAAQDLPAARPCTEAELTALTAEASAPYVLRCQARLSGRAILRPVLIQGAEASGAAIIDVHSALSWFAVAGGYSASKAALWSATNSLRLELAPQGVHVLGLHVGYVDTPMSRTVTPEDAQMLMEFTPLGRRAEPEEMAPMFVFLASDESSYVNGHALVVDGGLSSSHPFNNQSYGRTAI